jgi:hypothetical protein
MTRYDGVDALGVRVRVRVWGVVAASVIVVGWVAAPTRSAPVDSAAVCMCEIEATTPRASVIVVTRSEVIYEGQLVASVDNELLNRGDSPTFRLDALYERLDARAHKIYGGVPGNPDASGSDRLVLVEAVEGTDLRLLHKIVATANAAGYEVVLVYADRRPVALR